MTDKEWFKRMLLRAGGSGIAIAGGFMVHPGLGFILLGLFIVSLPYHEG